MPFFNHQQDDTSELAAALRDLLVGLGALAALCATTWITCRIIIHLVTP